MTSALKTKPHRAPFDGYDPESFFDEMVAANGEIRPHYSRFGELFQNITKEEFDRVKRKMAERMAGRSLGNQSPDSGPGGSHGRGAKALRPDKPDNSQEDGR